MRRGYFCIKITGELRIAAIQKTNCFSRKAGAADTAPAWRSKICHFRGFHLQLQFVSDKGNKLGICGFSLGIAHRIAEEPLQGVQIPSVPGHFNGMADGPLHSAGGGLEGFCHLGVQDLGDGIDHIHIVYRDNDGLPQILIAFDMGGNADLVDDIGDKGLDAGLPAAA